ncbi:MAG TPA: hypothetical protein VGC79_22210 [Polyangiaceae bacterium]
MNRLSWPWWAVVPFPVVSIAAIFFWPRLKWALWVVLFAVIGFGLESLMSEVWVRSLSRRRRLLVGGVYFVVAVPVLVFYMMMSVVFLVGVD